MAFSCFASADTVDAFGRAGACEGGVVGGAFAFDVVVVCSVWVAAQRTYDGTFVDRAFCDQVVKRMASIASTKNWECDILFDSGDGSKEGRRIANELLDSGPVGVNEGDCDGRMSLVRGDGR